MESNQKASKIITDRFIYGSRIRFAVLAVKKVCPVIVKKMTG